MTAEHLDQVLHPQFAAPATRAGQRAGARRPGRRSGAVYFTADDAAAAAAARGEAVILVRSETSPEDVHGMLASEGILTARGGLVSHAAVVARGWGKPAVVGRRGGPHQRPTLHGGRRHRAEGDWLSIDGTAGEVALGAGAPDRAEPPEEFGDDPRRGPTRCARASSGCGPTPTTGRRGQRPPLRGRGHRPVPDRAHVPGRGPPPDRAAHDPGRHARARRRARSRSCGWPSGPTSSRSSRPWTASR